MIEHFEFDHANENGNKEAVILPNPPTLINKLSANEINGIKDKINEIIDKGDAVPYGDLKVFLKGNLAGIPNTGNGIEVGDVVHGFATEDVIWSKAIYNGGDPNERSSYTPIGEEPKPNKLLTVELSDINDLLDLSLSSWQEVTPSIKAEYISAVNVEDVEDYYIEFNDTPSSPDYNVESVIICDVTEKPPFSAPIINVQNIVWTYVVPAFTIPENCIIEFDIKISKDDDAATGKTYLLLSQTDLGAGSRLGQSQINVGEKTARLVRTCNYRGGVARVISNVLLAASDFGNTVRVPQDFAINRSINNSFSIIISCENTTDQHIFEYFIMKIIKQKL